MLQIKMKHFLHMMQTLQHLDLLEEDETIMKEKEWQGIRVSSKAGQELTPISWRRFEDAKYFVAILLDNLTEASECQRYFLTQF